MFIEVLGRRALPGGVDRDDVEDLLAEALGDDGEVTGAGTGQTGWNLDVETFTDDPGVVPRLAAALAGAGFGWIELRPEHVAAPRPAGDLL